MTTTHSTDSPIHDERPVYLWRTSLNDWFKQLFSRDFSDSAVENRLLSYLPFYPESDGKRVAKLIDTPIGDGTFIHEFYLENLEKPDPARSFATTNSVKDIVLVHGYAASLGLFLENFTDLSSIPGVRVHAIDLPGFGFSSRPKYPSFPSETKEDIYANEDWFIDRLEEWRKIRGIDRFVLIGHSFGGYLSCAYTMKYNRNLVDAATGVTNRLVEKLVLLSPVGLERHKESIRHLPSEKKLCLDSKQPHPIQEVTMNQEDIVNGQVSDPAMVDSPTDTMNAASSEDTLNTKLDTAGKERSNLKNTMTTVFKWMWQRNLSPFSLIRNIGPAKSKMVSMWTRNRFAHVYYTDPTKFQYTHDYFYRVFNKTGSGEYAITRILGWGALAKLPLLDRCPEKFVKMNLPTLWLYGDSDWMDANAGLTMTKEINELAMRDNKGVVAHYGILPNAGHHLYMDNSEAFAKQLFKFLDS